jgi:hypothetical protein
MNLFGAFFPTTYILMLASLVVGFILAFVMFGTVSVLGFLFLLNLGVIRIKPIIDLIHTYIEYIFPSTCKVIRENIRASFPVTVCESLPEKGIYIIHPHGLFSMSQGMHVCTNFTDWPERNIKATALHTLWNIPFTHEFLEACVPSKYEEMKKVIHTNTSLSVCIGGVSEIAKASDATFSLKIKGRTGVFKLALETGTPLVPVLVYGENEVFQSLRGPFIDVLQTGFGWAKIPFTLPTLGSLYKTINLIREPYDIKVKTFLGKAIPVEKIEGEEGPTEHDVSSLRDTYMSSLKELYIKTRPDEYPEEIEFF